MMFHDPTEEAAFYDMLGGVFLSQNNSRQAVECYEQCLAIARKLNNRLKEGEALGNLGNAHLELGEYGRAGDFYQQCLTIAREIKDGRIEAASLKNIRITADRFQDLSKAQLEAGQSQDVFESARRALEL